MSDYTDEQKKAFVAMAQKQGRPKAAAAAKVTTNTISNWAKASGVTFSSVPGRPPKKRAAKKKGARANGKANGHGKPTGIEAAGAGQLDSVRDQLLAALKSVETMRTALRQVFG